MILHSELRIKKARGRNVFDRGLCGIPLPCARLSRLLLDTCELRVAFLTYLRANFKWQKWPPGRECGIWIAECGMTKS